MVIVEGGAGLGKTVLVDAARARARAAGRWCSRHGVTSSRRPIPTASCGSGSSANGPHWALSRVTRRGWCCRARRRARLPARMRRSGILHALYLFVSELSQSAAGAVDARRRAVGRCAVAPVSGLHQAPARRAGGRCRGRHAAGHRRSCSIASARTPRSTSTCSRRWASRPPRGSWNDGSAPRSTRVLRSLRARHRRQSALPA